MWHIRWVPPFAIVVHIAVVLLGSSLVHLDQQGFPRQLSLALFEPGFVVISQLDGLLIHFLLLLSVGFPLGVQEGQWAPKEVILLVVVVEVGQGPEDWLVPQLFH